jgi:hypothetical protein
MRRRVEFWKMTINLKCECGQQLHVEDRFAGAKGKCPECGRPVAVPIPASSSSPLPVAVRNSADQVHLPPQVIADRSGQLVGPDPVLESRTKTLIDSCREEYKKALRIIDEDIGVMIKQGKEMRALMLLGENMAKIVEIHESLCTFYTIILRNVETLRSLGSERLKQLGHDPLPVRVFLKCANISDEEVEKYVLNKLQEQGVRCNHWLMKDVFIGEIEYMLDALQILIEPDFIPIDDARGETDGHDRYVPPAVKLAVWRRDQGKCVTCGSNERLEYDHIIPITKGGSNTERNVQLLCEKCNRAKAASIA